MSATAKRDGARVNATTNRSRQRIEALQGQCDLVALLEAIRRNQVALVNGVSEPNSEPDQSAKNQELNPVLGSLRGLWGGRSEPTKRGSVPRQPAHVAKADG